MTCHEFDDIYAQLDWADRQVEIIAGDLAAFMQAQPYRIVREPHGDAIHDAFYLEATTCIRKSLGPPVATALQSQRSALDYLAVALARRQGCRSVRDVSFPFAHTAEEFAEDRILGKMRRLSAADQERIKDLKPYGGGNDWLYALHWLNLESKHRQLNLTGAVAGLDSIGGTGRLYGIRTFTPCVTLNKRGLIAITRQGTDCQIDFQVDVAFAEIAGRRPTVPLVPMLSELSVMCRQIVGLFERA